MEFSSKCGSTRCRKAKNEACRASFSPLSQFLIPKGVFPHMTYRIIVLQGVSGSGKSTAAKAAAQGFRVAGRSVAIVSADDYFMRVHVDGSTSYEFDPSKLGEAHASCFRRYLDALQTGVDVIFVDNTSTTTMEVAP